MGPHHHPTSRWFYCSVVWMSVVVLIFAEDGLPVNPRFWTMNLNSTLIWDRPDSAHQDDNITYNVRYQEEIDYLARGIDWIVKEDCTNVIAQSCNFGDDFGTKPFSAYWLAEVQAQNTDDWRLSNWTDYVKVQPYYDGYIGRPIITVINTTSNTIYLEWLAPKTPYYDDDGNVKHVDDIQAVFYNISYMKTDGTGTKISRDLNTNKDVTLEEGIEPYTSYDIVLQGKVQITGRYGIPLLLSVTTEESVPGKGVDITRVFVHPPVCDDPDLRDVEIEWLPIAEEYHYGVLTHYEVHYSYDNNTIHIQPIPDVNATSTRLTGLSRWELYVIIVNVCNSAGCTRHINAPYTLDPDNVATDPPTSLSAHSTTSTSFNISWQPPANDECILGYQLIYQDSKSLSNESLLIVDSLYAHITDVPGAYYTIYVSALIYADYNNSVVGSHAATGINLGDTSIVLLIILIILICIVFIISAAMGVAAVYRYRGEDIKQFIKDPIPQKQWSVYVKTELSRGDTIPCVPNPVDPIEEYDVITKKKKVPTATLR